jgi:hypothetical protein
MNVEWTLFGGMAFMLATAACSSQASDRVGNTASALTICPGVTLDPANTGGNIVLSARDMTATELVKERASTRATDARTSGKLYWEIALRAPSPGYGSYPMIGVGTASQAMSGLTYIGSTSESWGFYPGNAPTRGIYHAGWYGPYGEYADVGDVIGVALDLDAGTLAYFRDGKPLGQAFGDLPKGVALYPMIGTPELYFKASVRFAEPFAFPAPEGYAPFDEASYPCRCPDGTLLCGDTCVRPGTCM